MSQVLSSLGATCWHKLRGGRIQRKWDGTGLFERPAIFVVRGPIDRLPLALGFRARGRIFVTLMVVIRTAAVGDRLGGRRAQEGDGGEEKGVGAAKKGRYFKGETSVVKEGAGRELWKRGVRLHQELIRAGSSLGTEPPQGVFVTILRKQNRLEGWSESGFWKKATAGQQDTEQASEQERNEVVERNGKGSSGMGRDIFVVTCAVTIACMVQCGGKTGKKGAIEGRVGNFSPFLITISYIIHIINRQYRRVDDNVPLD
ncbi:hypothetical protein K435DRAFT_809867 [Dendrothele bispora CBS 962.96]|uniref:Uncharacterized protein n=1 Tax=Dendrothele bispora (strain CBS 962.96) TaxID=1314807 RepID=A0A4S8KX83_DENBC|nr:hypothetical protein K435DRAFT_809867 [Dendrothele bispora CBS 962.96]